jgi:hypothetical protein
MQQAARKNNAIKLKTNQHGEGKKNHYGGIDQKFKVEKALPFSPFNSSLSLFLLQFPGFSSFLFFSVMLSFPFISFPPWRPLSPPPAPSP